MMTDLIAGVDGKRICLKDTYLTERESPLTSTCRGGVVGIVSETVGLYEDDDIQFRNASPNLSL